MCLAVPARLVACEGTTAVADLHGNRLEVSTLLVPDAQTDDWVLIHAGFAIRRLDPAELEETWAVLHDARATEDAGVSDRTAPTQRGGDDDSC